MSISMLTLNWQFQHFQIAFKMLDDVAQKLKEMTD